MINLWKYEYCGNVKMEDMEGNIFAGDAQNVVNSEERSDLERKPDKIKRLKNNKVEDNNELQIKMERIIG